MDSQDALDNIHEIVTKMIRINNNEGYSEHDLHEDLKGLLVFIENEMFYLPVYSWDDNEIS